VQIDHIHLVISIPLRYAISEAIGFLKVRNAIKIFDIHHEPKKRVIKRPFRPKSYYISTIGLDAGQIRKYVKWQLHESKNLIKQNYGKNLTLSASPLSHRF